MAWLAVACVVAAVSALGACGGDGDGPAGPVGPPGPPGPPGPGNPVLGATQPLPGMEVVVTQVTGGTGPGGHFQAGDSVHVFFTAKTDAGVEHAVNALDFAEIYASGPSTGYQPLYLARSDVAASSVYVGGGVWRYTLPPIPAVYPAPYNDSPSFGIADGERRGLPILEGTYTVAVGLTKIYSDVQGHVHRDSGTGLGHFLIGSTATFVVRDVVGNANCNSCHVDLRHHGDRRKDVRACVLCHTAGAEDRNDPAVEGGTAGVTVDFRVMIHKIHAGRHLPSVLGVTTDASGDRDHAAPPRPLLYVGAGGEVQDYSEVGFPVWPSLNIGMPRDLGYSTLPAPARAKEDAILTGPVACAKCHGDPDGAGPLGAPAQGNIAYTQPTRASCGSCHADVVWTHPYRANGLEMPPQPFDGACAACHEPTGGPSNGLPSTESAHRHPLLEPAQNPGLVVTLLDVSEVPSGGNPNVGRVDPGERVSITVRFQDLAGNDVSPSSLASIPAVLSGPTENLQLILNGSLPTTHPALQGAAPSHTLRLPERLAMEWLGTSNGATLDTFSFDRGPLFTAAGMAPVVRRRTGTAGGASALAAPASALDNFVTVGSVAGFGNGDHVVLDDAVPATKEILQVGYVDAAASRLWFNTALRFAHGAGSSVLEITTAAVTTFSVDTANATITETAEFGAGDVFATSYWTEFVMPAAYPPPLNDSPDLDATVGEWKGLPIVAGTYTLDVWGSRTFFVDYDGAVVPSTVGFPDATTYRGTSGPGLRDFLVGAATVLRPYDLISGAENCHACHDDLWFHGAQRRGWGTCVACHGTVAAEDRPRFVSPTAEETPGVAVSFRVMLHKIHMGRDLSKADQYKVVGFGPTTHMYDEVGFPAMPDGVKQCVKCHGNDAWTQPDPREHPTAGPPVREWAFVCSSCHDSDAAFAHMGINTPGGVESCVFCHGPAESEAVEVVHFVR